MEHGKTQELLSIAENAAIIAGKIISRATTRSFRHKGNVDLVTETDIACEEAICSFLKRETPHINILAEEGGGEKNGNRWIVDPLDGTTNFAHGFPHYGVSIGLQQNDELIVGVIYAPCSDEMFLAGKNLGSYCNQTRIHVSSVDTMQQSLIGTGFPYDRQENPARYTTYLNAILASAQGVRRAGSAALDLAYIAAGRLDGFWEFGLKPWDMAAGILLIQEAGGMISTIHGDQHHLLSPSIVASNAHIHSQLLATLNNEC